MRIIHTADWHLGHTLHDEDRAAEHEAFLTWLLDLLEQEDVDQLVIAGDVFETANPPARALEAYYRFLSTLHSRLPGVGVVVLGGNHDSAARLEAPREVLRSLDVQVLARLPRGPEGPRPADLVIPLSDRSGEVRAWMAAVPYLRPADLPRVEVEEGQDPLIEGVRAVYEQAVAEARRRREPGQALLGGGHCYMYGGDTSDLSERRILVGGEHALPVGLFPDDLVYVALGHLHKAQKVGGHENVRYSGSPIPLSFAEVNYKHQVVLVELSGDQVERIEPRPVPRAVELLRLGPLEPEALLAALAQLPEADDSPRDTWPMLEARARLDEPEPGLRGRVDEVVADRKVRLLRLGREGRRQEADAPVRESRSLRELKPEEVFRRRWDEGGFDGELPEELLRAFHELLEEVGAVKILAIRGEDLASLAGPFEVDLVRGPLADANLFAIHGPTGAGKSTLLDAMCLALFDKTPRLERGGVPVGRASVDEKDRVSSRDPRSLLRYGAGKGSAEVDFSGQGGRRYRARWEVRRARGKAAGRLQKVSWSLEPLDGEGERASAKKSEVAPAIEAALGLTYDQFCRSVLLPQGAFARFLQAPENERAELLERVTGTEVYRELSKAAYRRRGEAEGALAEMEAALGAVERLSPEARDELEKAQQAAQRERDTRVARRQALARLQAAQAAQETRCSEEAAAGERVTARQEEASVKASAAVAAREVAAAAGKALEERLASQASAREQLVAARALDQELASHLERVAGRERARDEAQEAARVAEEAHRAASARAEEAARNEEVARAWLQEHASLEAIADEFPVLRQDLERLAGLSELREAAAAAGEAVEAREVMRRDAEEKDSVAREALVVAEAARDAAREALKAVPDPEPEAARLRELRELLRQLEDAARRAREAGEAVDAAREEAAAAKAAAEFGEGEAKVARARAEEAAAGAARTRQALDLEDRRGELVAGEPCPLCGAEDHPYAEGGGPGAQVLAEQEARAQELEAAAREQASQVAAQRARQQQAEGAATRAEERRHRALREGEVPAEAWRQAERPAELPEDPRDPGVEAALGRQEQACEERRAALAERRRAAEETQAAFEARRGERDTTRDALGEAARLREEAEQAAARAREELLAREALATEVRAELEESLGSEAAERVARDPAQLARDLGARLEEWRARHHQREEATRARELALADRERAAADRAAAGPRKANTEKELEQAVAAREALRARRAGLLEGRPADEVEAELERAAAERREAKQVADAAAAKASQAEAVAGTRLEEARAAATTAKEAREKAEAELASATRAAPPDPEGRTIEAEQVLLEEAMRLLDEEAGARRERLEQDRAAAGRQAEMETKLEPLRVEARRWGQLGELIGSADGARFRTYAQGLTLDRLLGEANHHLRELAPRYHLDRVPGHALALQVVDRDLGDEVRAVEGLSGGETFLVSLALALGLSGLAAERTPIESLFVDEGFGTLDPVSLDRAVEVLESLQDGGRQVGVISHVAGLAERIGASVEVERLGAGRSRVRVSGARGTLAP